jgi:glycosyltransferase involved in cell wall biosynthesis
MKKILFLVPYPLSKAPSQRFRVEAFFSCIGKAGLKFSVHSFLDQQTWTILYQKGNLFLKSWGITKGFLRRWRTIIFNAPFYDFIFIHRESAPIGPPIFEWIIAKIYRKRIIYDFDDAIWIPNTSSANLFSNWCKAFWKVKYICKWSHKIAVGNDFLYSYASQFSGNVVKIPTCVDIKKDQEQCQKYDRELLNIGWTGSHSTLKYLNGIIPVINELQKNIDFNFLVIADKNPLLPFKNFEFIPWNASTETKDLSRLDVGIMPLVADAWSEGKCGFKLIQYFACEIPAIASPVGVNKIIIDQGINGFLCRTDDEWISSLKTLLVDGSLRKRMGKAGREKIEEQYSIQSQERKFIAFFS